MPSSSVQRTVARLPEEVLTRVSGQHRVGALRRAEFKISPSPFSSSTLHATIRAAVVVLQKRQEEETSTAGTVESSTGATMYFSVTGGRGSEHPRHSGCASV
jgi:hypothetical protein